jgi:predicted MFS family arabinose efflux permease
MADSLGWRWEFGVQVPPILICITVAYFVIPDDLGISGKRETFWEAMAVFDFKGSILLTLSTTFLILGLVSYSSRIPCPPTAFLRFGKHAMN